LVPAAQRAYSFIDERSPVRALISLECTTTHVVPLSLTDGYAVYPRYQHTRIGRHIINFSDLQQSAVQLNDLYEQFEVKKWGRIWTTEELALGFVGDVGDLAKLIQANAGVRDIPDCKAKLGHELSDCLWSIIILASKCGIDLESEFVRNTREIGAYVSDELNKQPSAT
jgi:NTP pyrophosphatase (non-canonical NTP hydrolase)